MHRHGYKGRKLQLEAGPRKALIRGQITSLVLHEQITTTEAKAKEIAPRFEKLVTKAKKGDLHNRRQIRSILLTDKATEKLVEEIAPAFKDRNGGYTRVVKVGNRLGDNAAMATVMLTEKIQRAATAAPAKAAPKDAKAADKDDPKAEKAADTAPAATRRSTRAAKPTNVNRSTGSRTGRRGEK
jgi:large subunit ribosomal protein L17